ncbi:diacylglycerol kinase family protein [Microbacterium sp. MPKO10]|uniref:diacylglycerol/lipid kinase family protein n=1 Tax=Microbacterium sp. MPKO10 TaxID=2989818 RepID=UPI0022366AB8|nr:diacylglycerol kinase family protein [Microbacterium sp. MPKO10]MCW4456796.1 diacylglycerol kinase family protein [Microbacterium sp. MPKO10]
MSVEGERFAAVVYNPVKLDAAKLKQVFTAGAAEHGWAEPRFVETTVDDPGVSMARDAVAAGASLVVAAGGDGTVRSVAEGLRSSGIPLAIVPAGTGNLLARNLDLPLNNLKHSMTVAYTGTQRSIDMGIAEVRADDGTNEYVFLVMAGMGIDAQMIANTNDDLKKSVGWLAYADAVVRSVAGLKPFRIRYQLAESTPHSAHVSTILVANCGTLPAGIELLPDAKIDDGKLDLAVLQPKGVLGWLQVWRKVRWENGVLRRSSIGRRILKASEGRDSTVTYLRSAMVTVKPDDAQELELDGDEIGTTSATRFTVDPGALTVMVHPKR